MSDPGFVKFQGFVLKREENETPHYYTLVGLLFWDNSILLEKKFFKKHCMKMGQLMQEKQSAMNLGSLGERKRVECEYKSRGITYQGTYFSRKSLKSPLERFPTDAE